jgi:xanthine dehydrogenase accessory factor
VAKLCEVLDYPYVVLDDRRDYARPAHFKGALEVACARGDKFFARKPAFTFSHVVGLGYDAEFDLDGLIPALKKLPAHVQFGTIGSKPKFAKMSALARKRGVSAKQWARVKCPVGMSIGAQTPAEIAVAIMADVVASLPGRESHGWK